MAPSKEELDTLESSLKDLNLTNEEMNKFEKAFKDPEFLKLFEDYAREVSDPKAKAETEMYLRQLEQQGRGEDVYGKGVQLIAPKPAMVLKSKVMGSSNDNAHGGTGGGAGDRKVSLPVGQKVFINVCISEKVDRYSLTDARDASGRVGKQLYIPLTLGPKREGTDKTGQPASVYDFVVNPASMDFAASNAAAMQSLAETALEQVEKVSGSRLSHAWRRLNYRYKATEGCTEPPVQTIRTNAEAGDSVGGRLRPRADVPAVDVPGAKAPPAVPSTAGAGAAAAANGEGSSSLAAANGADASGPGGSKRSTFSFDRPKAEKLPEVTDPAQAGFRHPDGGVTPEWALVHRGDIDLAASWGDAGKGLALAAPHVPKELVVRVTLPGLDSAAAVDLDVGERRLDLKVPGRYRLSVPLPHNVDEARGRAKFDKARKQLEITLPVIPPPPPPPRPVPAAEATPSSSPAEGEASKEAAEEAPPVATTPATATQVAAAAVLGPLEAAEGPASAAGPGSAAATRANKEEAEGPTGTVASAMAEAGAGPGERVPPVGGSSGAGTGEDAGCETASSSGGAGGESGGDGASGSGIQLTENERRWREIHSRQAAEPDQAAEGGQRSAASAAAAGESGHSATGEPAAESPAQQAAAHGGRGGSAGAGAGASVDAAAEPVVMLRPRLRSQFVMELD